MPWFIASFFLVGIKAIRKKANDCDQSGQRDPSHRHDRDPYIDGFLDLHQRSADRRAKEREQCYDPVLSDDL
jgi:hypothetical protein